MSNYAVADNLHLDALVDLCIRLEDEFFETHPDGGTHEDVANWLPTVLHEDCLEKFERQVNAVMGAPEDTCPWCSVEALLEAVESDAEAAEAAES